MPIRPTGDSIDGGVGDGNDETYLDGSFYPPDDAGSVVREVAPTTHTLCVRISFEGGVG